MGKYDNLSDEELLKALLEVSPETLAEFRELDEQDAGLLALNLQGNNDLPELQSMTAEDLERYEEMDRESECLLTLNLQNLQLNDDDSGE